MKRLIIISASSVLLIFLSGCVPKKAEIKHVYFTKSSLSTSSGNASIILKDDGTIEIKGAVIKIISSGEMVLIGKPIASNPIEEESNTVSKDPAQAQHDDPAGGFTGGHKKNILKATKYLSVHEIFEKAAMTYAIHAGGEAQMLPLPIKRDGTVQIVILYYNEPLYPGKEIIYPPHRMMTINPETGEVLGNRKVTPADFGFPKTAMGPMEGYGLDAHMTSDEFWHYIDQFHVISPLVWELYSAESRQVSDEDKDLLMEYEEIFRRVAKTPLIPYYKAVAPDLFEWLSKTLNK